MTDSVSWERLQQRLASRSTEGADSVASRMALSANYLQDVLDDIGYVLVTKNDLRTMVAYCTLPTHTVSDDNALAVILARVIFNIGDDHPDRKKRS